MKLTKKETQICKLLVIGKNNSQIANELHCSNHTIKWHISAILNKTGANNRTHLAFLLGWDRIIQL
ncbi:MAG: helix-turn-helix transcriptional regulator [Cyanobacteria bacterium SIG26]|nr:helix-turn-helix transcriptional regulator [Cyanobacteria bacterium SIG26]